MGWGCYGPRSGQNRQWQGRHCGVATDRGVPGIGVGKFVEGVHCGSPPEVPPGVVDVGREVDGPVFNGRELSMCRTWSIG